MACRTTHHINVEFPHLCNRYKAFAAAVTLKAAREALKRFSYSVPAVAACFSLHTTMNLTKTYNCARFFCVCHRRLLNYSCCTCVALRADMPAAAAHLAYLGFGKFRFARFFFVAPL